MPTNRKCEDWLKALLEYVEDTEAPRLYWLWGGISAISSALQRRVWVPYGLEDIYPNLYIIIVARAGERKGGPLGLTKRMLEDIYIPVSVDSTSKRALTKELAKVAETCLFTHPDGTQRRMSAEAVISKELGSLLAIDKENMIITLTDLWDSHDSWKYNTSDKGHDFLFNVCITLFAATTPRYIVNNLPPDAYAEGFASRALWLSELPFYKSVYWPKPFEAFLYKKLIHDLGVISQLTGEFKIAPGAKKLFKDWYDKIPARKLVLRDERIRGNLNRLHLMVLKTAMCLRVARTNTLIAEEDDIGRAIDLVEDIFSNTTKAFGMGGYSRLGPMIQKVGDQIMVLENTTKGELMTINSMDLSISELEEVLRSLEMMGRIEMPITVEGPDQKIRGVKRKDQKQ